MRIVIQWRVLVKELLNLQYLTEVLFANCVLFGVSINNSLQSVNAYVVHILTLCPAGPCCWILLRWSCTLSLWLSVRGWLALGLRMDPGQALHTSDLLKNHWVLEIYRFIIAGGWVWGWPPHPGKDSCRDIWRSNSWILQLAEASEKDQGSVGLSSQWWWWLRWWWFESCFLCASLCVEQMMVNWSITFLLLGNLKFHKCYFAISYCPTSKL
jgi:hypothetical protein